MIVYNVTTKVDKNIVNEWLAWVKEEHTADLINTGCFTYAKTFKLMEADDSEGPTFTIQYFAESKRLYNLYQQKFAGIMRKKAFDKWGNKFIAFHSIMQVVE